MPGNRSTYYPKDDINDDDDNDDEDDNDNNDDEHNDEDQNCHNSAKFQARRSRFFMA